LTDRNRFSLALVLVLAMVLVGAVTGCTKSQTSGGGSTAQTTTGPQKGGTLSYYIGEPAAIDPYNTQESEGTNVESNLFDSLTAFDPLDPSKIIPAAAEKWEANADATVWTFHLNKNDKFADGTPVTAKDFIYAWNRIANPKTLNTATKQVDPSQISYHLAPVQGFDAVAAGKATQMSGLKAIDDYTLQVTLTKPFGDWEYVVAHPALAPVPQALVEGGVDYNGTKVPYGEMPIGNGPFKMKEPWKPGQFINVVRNDNYYGPKALLDEVDFKIFKDPDTAYLEFQAGNLDFCQITLGKIKDAEAKYGVSENGYTVEPQHQVLLGAEDSIYYLVCNNTKAPMDNIKFREALSLGINRQAICDTLFEGSRRPADNIIPPGIAGYQPGIWPDVNYDTTAAAKMLSDAGYPGGKGAPEFSLWYNSDGGHQKIMELVQSDLTKLGLKVKLSPTPDFPTYLKQLSAGKALIGRLGWSADYPIMYNFLYSLFNSKAADNYSKLNDPAIDKAIDDASKMTDTAARIAAFQAVDKQIGEKFPVIPLMFYNHHYVGSARVHDLTYGAMNLPMLGTAWVSASK
jgi:oligopeptide transport system substrate-binding protein